MKKISLFFVLASVVFFVLFSGCSKTSVTAIATAAPTDYAAFVSVPAGTFTQTDTIAHSFVHTISAFKIGKYEVTYDLWYTVKTWATSNGYVFANAGMEGYDGVRASGAAPTTAAKNQV
ncbi:MAG: hypothetical protein WCJ94_05415, partial [bacterium]